MKNKGFRVVCGLTLAFLSAISAFTQEGHPMWWWDAKRSDLVVEGVIAYDSANYYEIKAANAGPNTRTVKGHDYYWIVGRLRINKILFINAHSQYLESYQQLVKEIDKEHVILIPAMRQTVFSSHGPKPATFQLRPMFGLDIPQDAAIFNLSQIYIYPILDLKLESAVPQDKTVEVLKLITDRPNNSIKKASP